jgi:sporulation protein YtfJ
MAPMPPARKQPVKTDLPDRSLSPWELALRATGARLCYGEPVEADGRTVIPVASVEAAGGAGWGRTGNRPEDDEEATGAEGKGGGLGGWVSATPVGFIEIGPDGTRFRRIIDPVSLARGLAGSAAKGAVVWVRERGRRR